MFRRRARKNSRGIRWTFMPWKVDLVEGGRAWGLLWYWRDPRSDPMNPRIRFSRNAAYL